MTVRGHQNQADTWASDTSDYHTSMPDCVTVKVEATRPAFFLVAVSSTDLSVHPTQTVFSQSVSRLTLALHRGQWSFVLIFINYWLFNELQIKIINEYPLSVSMHPRWGAQCLPLAALTCPTFPFYLNYWHCPSVQTDCRHCAVRIDWFPQSAAHHHTLLLQCGNNIFEWFNLVSRDKPFMIRHWWPHSLLLSLPLWHWWQQKQNKCADDPLPLQYVTCRLYNTNAFW